MRTKDERQALRERRQADKARAQEERQAAREQEREERQRRRQERREELRHKVEERETRKEAASWLPHLGVCVYDGEVYQHGDKQSGGLSDLQASNERNLGLFGKLLGPLAGAQAEVVGGKAGRRRSGNARFADAVLATSVLGHAGLLAGAYSRAGTEGIAIVVFANGTYHEKKINDPGALVRAENEAIRFNALAATAGGSPEQNADSGTARQLTDQLERLTVLRESGALTDPEFQAAKARLLAM
jgi:hypothetical protein